MRIASYSTFDIQWLSRLQTSVTLNTGVDITGHLSIQIDGSDRKVYLMIFTCLNVRAIHLELDNDVSTHRFVLAMIRFINIYGIPSHILTTLGLCRRLQLVYKMYTSSEFSHRLGRNNI